MSSVSMLSHVPLWMVGALIVLAAGAGPLIGWLASAFKVKRFAQAFALAVCIAAFLVWKAETVHAAATSICDYAWWTFECWWEGK